MNPLWVLKESWAPSYIYRMTCNTFGINFLLFFSQFMTLQKNRNQMLSVICPCKIRIENSIYKKLASSKDYLPIVHSINVLSSILDILWKHFLLEQLLVDQNIEKYVMGYMSQCNDICQQRQERLTEKINAIHGLANSKYPKQVSISWQPLSNFRVWQCIPLYCKTFT